MKYFLDNDISPKFAEMLRALDVNIVALREVMSPSTKDSEFLADLRRKFDVDVFISKDTSQRTNPIEAGLLKQSGVTSLYFNPFFGKLTVWPQAKWLVNHWEKLDGFVRGASVGTCADIQQNGRCKTFSL